jgi:hypothetical protein
MQFRLASLSLMVSIALSSLVFIPFGNFEAVLAQESSSELLLDVEGVLETGDLVLSEDQSLYDRYTFNGRAGQRVGITLESLDFDPYMVLQSPNNEKIEENDDYDEFNPSAGLIVTLPTDGSYTVIANGYDAQSQGRYRLKVTLLSAVQQDLIFSETTQQPAEADQQPSAASSAGYSTGKCQPTSRCFAIVSTSTWDVS